MLSKDIEIVNGMVRMKDSGLKKKDSEYQIHIRMYEDAFMNAVKAGDWVKMSRLEKERTEFENRYEKDSLSESDVIGMIRTKDFDYKEKEIELLRSIYPDYDPQHHLAFKFRLIREREYEKSKEQGK